MRDHRKLEAFELADSMALQIYAITRTFPPDEKFGLTAQLRRAAVSIGANIVEGTARESKADYVRFLGIAYASARELEYEFSLGRSARVRRNRFGRTVAETGVQNLPRPARIDRSTAKIDL